MLWVLIRSACFHGEIRKNYPTIIPKYSSLTIPLTDNEKKIKVRKIPRKCQNHEAQPSRGTKRRRDEKQIMITQVPHMKPPTLKEELQQGNRLGTASRNSTLIALFVLRTSELKHLSLPNSETISGILFVAL